MKYPTAPLIFVLLLAGCGGGTPAPPEAPPEATPGDAPSAEAPTDMMDMNEVEMQLWPSSDAPAQGTRPLLSIRAQRVTGSLDGTTAELSFEGAQAVVPPQEEGDSNINFEAARGTYQQNRRAVLSGGVTAQIDDMAIALEDITWEILPQEGAETSTGLAFSDNPLKIASPTQNLEAARLRLYPDTQTMELYDVKGTITFTGEQP